MELWDDLKTGIHQCSSNYQWAATSCEKITYPVVITLVWQVKACQTFLKAIDPNTDQAGGGPIASPPWHSTELPLKEFHLYTDTDQMQITSTLLGGRQMSFSASLSIMKYFTNHNSWSESSTTLWKDSLFYSMNSL